MKALNAKYFPEKKVFEIEITKEEKIQIASSGLFDDELALLNWASKNDGKALGYLDGSKNYQYVLVYGGNIYDVEVDEK